MHWRSLPFFVLHLALWLCFPGAAAAQSGANVVVVANAANAASVRIAERYAQARDLPAAHVIRLTTLPAEAPETISRLHYEHLIERPIANWFAQHAAHDRIFYIVLTKGIPIRIDGSSGRKGLQASVDSELTLLYRSLTGRPVAPQGSVPNPYFAGDGPSDRFTWFTHREQDIFLVTRLDGFTEDDVMALIDRGIAPTRDGQILLDEKAALENPGNAWLRAAADRLGTAGFAERTVHEATSRVLSSRSNVLGYYSWGSSDPAITTRRLDLGFVPGALAASFVSSDARTFREPPAEWTPGPGTDRRTHYAGSPQSLIGDLVREGVTGVAGHIAEPYFDAAIRPDILFPAYVAGFNLAEAFYLAMPYLSWQTIVIGDPLCAPFRSGEPPAAETAPPIDPATQHTAFFAERRLAWLGRKGLKREALEQQLQGEARLARRDRQGGRAALEAATAADDRLTDAHTLLADLFLAEGEHDLALERYRRILAHEPRDAVALNNLAYGLAVYKKLPGDALPLAEKAVLLAPANPVIVDTLGWVHHLLGNHREALRYLTRAVRAAPENPDFVLHIASAYGAAGQLDAAKAALDRATTLRADLEERAEVQELRAKLAESQP